MKLSNIWSDKKGKSVTMENQLFENVWNRRDEALAWYTNVENDFKREQGIDPKKLGKICKEEGTTLDEFLPYAQERSKKENLQ